MNCLAGISSLKAKAMQQEQKPHNLSTPQRKLVIINLKTKLKGNRVH